MMFGTLFLQSMLPLFTRAIKEKNKSELDFLVTKSYKILLAFWIAIVWFSIVNWYEILRLVATPEYLDRAINARNSLDSYRITVFVFLFCFISSIFTYILIANNEQSRLLKLNFYLTLINVALNIILIPRYSFIWSSVATLISEIVMLTNTYIASRHIYKFNFLPLYTLTNVLFALIAWLTTFFLRSYLYSLSFTFTIVLVLCFVLFSIIYFWWIGVFFYRDKLKKIIL